MGRIGSWVLAGCAMAAVCGCEQLPGQGLGVDQIVEKNIAARGGLDAWRKVQTMVWSGHVDSPNAPVRNMPFVLAMKRPNKTRFEITVLNQKAVRVFDGREGWKQAASGSAGVRPYTPGELLSARDEQVIDGPLFDHDAKGIGVTLEGVDPIGGHDAYRLAVKLPSGAVRHVWIDGRSFLDVKADRQVRGPSGPLTVEVNYGNFKLIDGLQIPLRIESGTAAAPTKDTLIIDKVSLNPPLDDALFGRPVSPGGRRAASIDARVSAAPPGVARPTVRP
ncbi:MULTISPECIES: hypothetical protein [Burkholderia]|uniref:Uncharacterized protein n=1 Tax=Burkholderia contaminans TaxID=488447 RepID=A0A2S5DZS8_9BURK|nr:MULTISPECIES: hypothetical protein [Burkholderia]EKS9799133.1 hypothetical protein [Burkholderia cepacia]EKS9807658.1 hypothetical protein [Burkholderia cepacia]EKS9815258.1 hypothetical protein [Burkholderia cepacia]EKS9820372.1 hypothetical protein [Burkholderia cepacia]EKS9828332.1 hypothetical protein [Burkholderia cepacia]